VGALRSFQREGKKWFLISRRNHPEQNVYFKDFGRTLGMEHRQAALATVKNNRKQKLVSEL